MDSLIKTLELYFGKKAPQLPSSAKEIIVKILPYLIILALIATIPSILSLIGLSTFGGGFAYMYWGYGHGSFMLWAILNIVLLVLYAMAIPGLFKPSVKGWNYLFYAALVAVVQNLLTLNIVALIVAFIVEMYFLFQIRAYYMTGAHTSPSDPSVASTPPANS